MSIRLVIVVPDVLRVISGFCGEVDENCGSSGLLADVSGQPIGPILKDQE